MSSSVQRHPGEKRDLSAWLVRLKIEIPAFAGMTDIRGL